MFAGKGKQRSLVVKSNSSSSAKNLQPVITLWFTKTPTTSNSISFKRLEDLENDIDVHQLTVPDGEFVTPTQGCSTCSCHANEMMSASTDRIIIIASGSVSARLYCHSRLSL